ncbi:hypothetical protein BsWGS_25821 [Bradybaena similaris]
MWDYYLKFRVSSCFTVITFLSCLWVACSSPLSIFHTSEAGVSSILSEQLSLLISENAEVPVVKIIAKSKPYVAQSSTTTTTTTSQTTTPSTQIVPAIRLRVNYNRGLPTTTSTTQMPGPKLIGDSCHFDQQCQAVHPVSTCIVVNGNKTLCHCPLTTFIPQNRSACIPLPTGVGDPCQRIEHCNQTIENSECSATYACTCERGYFADNNRTICHRDPEKLGDFCHEHEQCNKAMVNSECGDSNNTCICTYGYTQRTAKSCVERERLPVYKQVDAPTVPGCQKNKCAAWTNSRCLTSKAFPEGLCHCDFRYARSFNSTQCVPVQTYELHLSLVREAKKYDYGPLNFTLDPDLVIGDQPLSIRITVSGLMELFNKSTSSSLLKGRYVASEVTSVMNLDETNRTTDKGAKVTVLLSLTANYLNATSVGDIYKFIEENLNTSGGLLGGSLIQVASPYNKSVVIRDYDECEGSDNVSSNDCHKNALCINTLGSYMCLCKYRYEDTSKAQGKLRGRVCSEPSEVDASSDLCSSDDCQTRWECMYFSIVCYSCCAHHDA